MTQASTSPTVDTTRPLASERSRPAGLSRRHREWLAAGLFLLPDSLGLLIFVGAPMLLSLSLGFFDVTGFGGYSFVGFDNYLRMFGDPLFLTSLRTTATYVVLLVPAVFVTGLGLALLVNQRLPLTPLFRGMLFLPHVISLVVIGLIWQFMLVDRVGVLNQFLSSLGLPGRSWLGNPDTALPTVLVVTVWFLMGYYMIIFLAGLQEIPREYYEAARIDGASGWRTFHDITLPLLRPTSFFVILVSTVTAVAGAQGFDLVFVMTNGGPANATGLVIFYIYQQAFLYGNFGYAAAMASFLVLVLLILTGILFKLTKGGRFDFD
ncbi:MAG: sugar ABC transporter permease [Chloroflexota bacterium]|nr:sugar ABC transporter permease [Chloroflexota bacterium]